VELTHLRLLTEDYKAAFSFYRDIMELPVKRGTELSGYAEFGAGDVRLALFCRKHMADIVGADHRPGSGAQADPMVIILRVASVDDQAAALRQKGVSLVAEPVDRPGWDVRTAHLRDPDGNLIEVNERLQ